MRIGECLEFGWETFKRNAGAFVLTTFVLMVASMALNVALSSVLKGAGGIASGLVGGLFSGGFMAVARKGARGEVPTLNDAFWPWTTRQGDFLIVGLLTSLGVLACGVGLLVTTFLFLFSQLLVVEGADWKGALTRSKDLVLANTGEAIVFYLVLMAVNVAGAIALGVGLLVSIPVSTLAIVKAYELASSPAILPPTVQGTI